MPSLLAKKTLEVLGFHTVEENLFSAQDYSFTETYYDAQNLLNILGWIPLLGTAVGAIRIGATGVMWAGNDESHRKSHCSERSKGRRRALFFGLAFDHPN